MPFDKKNIKAVVFDYGNTLIQFTEPQIHACDTALANVLQSLYGPLDFHKLKTVRDADRRAPYAGNFAENDMLAISANAVRELYNTEPTDEALESILRVRYEAFVDAVEAPHYLTDILTQLSQSYKLGILSNYPDGNAIRATLDKLNIAKFFDAVLISGDVGRVKPHAAPFRKILDLLAVAPHEALFVGDNWLGDIQGARRAGLRAAFIVQWDTPEKFPRQAGDHEPDFTISHLTELLDIL